MPIPPPQVRLFRTHLHQYVTFPDGHVFRGVKGGLLATVTYRRAWDRARKAAFDAGEYVSPQARRPYDLRHACLSTWLNGGVAPAQVAEWAGHSVEVLLRTYVRCLDGQHDIAKPRIMEALDDPARDDGEFRAASPLPAPAAGFRPISIQPSHGLHLFSICGGLPWRRCGPDRTYG